MQRWLEQAIKDHPKLVVLRMHLADLYDLRGDYAKSEELYRDMLKEEPGNVVALNNLAWLLAHADRPGRRGAEVHRGGGERHRPAGRPAGHARHGAT